MAFNMLLVDDSSTVRAVIAKTLRLARVPINELMEASNGKEGLEIPITGRIVAVADVYDALSSKRIYKDAWSEDKVLDYLRSQSGMHFDPEVINAFFNVYEVITAVRDKYKG